MAMQASEIQALIEEGLPGAVVKIIDLAGDGDHYEVHVTSSAFQGKSRVQQHQMIYETLGSRMGGELHALAIKTFLPNS